LDIDNAQKLLKVAGYDFSEYYIEDAIIKFSIENKIYDFDEIEETFQHYNLDSFLYSE